MGGLIVCTHVCVCVCVCVCMCMCVYVIDTKNVFLYIDGVCVCMYHIT